MPPEHTPCTYSKPGVLPKSNEDFKLTCILLLVILLLTTQIYYKICDLWGLSDIIF